MAPPPRFVAAAALALVSACRAVGAEPSGRVVLEAPGPERLAAVDPAFLPAFEALHAAVHDGEDAMARSILAGIAARRPPEHLADFAGCYERILDGRTVCRALELELVSEEVGGSGGDHQLVLHARHPLEEPVRLRLPPATLRRATCAVDVRGLETRGTTTEASRALSDLLVPPGELVVVPLCSYELDTRGALAVRERWTLETRSGAVELGGRLLPAREPTVRSAERTRLAAHLPSAPVEPEELVRCLESRDPSLAALLERAVRIDPARRDEALDRLAPCVEDLAERDPERLRFAAPALRWLAGAGRIGSHPDAWASWFGARRRAEGRLERGGLDLPEVGEAR